jgi:hypothetical protein
VLRRWRTGEWIAVGGLVGLIATLFLRWFTASIDMRCGPSTSDGRSTERICPSFFLSPVDTGWGALGRPWADFVIVAGVAVVIALLLTLRAGPGRPTYGAVVSLIVAGAVTFLVTLLTAVRVLLARPGGGSWEEAGARIDVTVGVGLGGWIGLASLVAIVVGLWIAVADDRTAAADSAFDPPAPRPTP